MRFSSVALLCASVCVCALPGATAQETSTSNDPLPVLEHKKLRQSIARLASEHSKIVEVLNIGALSREGRYVEVVRVAAGDLDQGRPALLVVANIDGPLAYTSSVVLDHIRRLAEGYADDERIQRLLDTTTLYFIPRANPDAAEARFESPLVERIASGSNIDNDRDGRSGEDSPEDVNGDGMITWMRYLDPDGTFIEDPTDARVLIEANADEGQRGKWKLVREGRDRDEDERVAEDPEWDAVVNRNFPHEWDQTVEGAGLFPTDEPEVRGICDFILSHPDIQLVLTYGEYDNLVGKVKSVADDAPRQKRVPPTGVRKSDAALLEELGRIYKELNARKNEGREERGGSFQQWCYNQRGLLSIGLELWSLPLDAKPAAEGDDTVETDGAEGEDEAKPQDKPSDDAKRLLWIDQNDPERFVDWKPYEHPELGPVEVGGFAPYGCVEPTEDELTQLTEREFDFLLELAERLARIELRSVTARQLADGLVHVEVEVANEAYLPLLTTWGKETRTTRPARLRVHLPDGARIVAGRNQVLISDLPGMGGVFEYEWLVAGATISTIGISVETDHAGSARAVPQEVK